uniref:CCHC-type domain-containing protein n=1 Tax=Cannabis sativa TaxID=3483 RepID=A0A803PUL2_CANSA
MDSLSNDIHSSLSLTDEERSVICIPEYNPPLPDHSTQPILLAKVLTHQNVYKQAFIDQMSGHWQGCYRVVITEYQEGDGLFHIKFGCEGNKRRVLTKEPWHFQNHLIVLRTPDALQNVSKDDLVFTPFWVQIYRLPFLSKSKLLAEALGNIIGEFLEVFDDSTNEGWGHFLRVRVNLCTNKPLLRGQMIRLPRIKDEFWVDFRYERLPEFCFECGRLGHPFERCVAFIERMDSGNDDDFQYGPWMKGEFSKNPFPLPLQNSHSHISPNFSHYQTPQSAFTPTTSSISPMPLSPATHSNILHSTISQPTDAPASFPCSFVSSQPSTTSTNQPSNSTPSPVSTPSNPKNKQPMVFSANLSQKHTPNTYDTNTTLNITCPSKPSYSQPHFSLCNSLHQQPITLSNTKSHPQSAASPGRTTHSESISDLSHIYMPKVHNQTFATYPPPLQTTQLHPNTTTSTLNVPLKHHPTIPSTIVSIGKENLPPTSTFKRQNDSLSMRKFLKRCRNTQGKLSDNSVSRVRQSLHFPNGLESPRSGLSGGLLLLWKDEVEITLLNMGSTFFDCYMMVENSPTVHLTCFYGAPEVNNRQASWTLFERLADVAPHLPWIVIGDFNEILSNSNKSGGALHCESQMDAFQKAIDKGCLHETLVEGDPFTWAKNRAATNTIKESIDWCFINNHWESFFECPQLHKDSTDPIAAVISNITTCAGQLQLWRDHKYGKMKKNIKKCQKQVEQLNNSSSHSSSHFDDLKQAESILDELLEQEEVYWQQRSRVDWLACGDRNTKYFHTKASARRTNNHIKFLFNNSGGKASSIADISTVVQDFYADLFTAGNIDECALAHTLDCIPTLVTNAHNDALLAPFTPAEVDSALKTMSLDKSPGIDGISAMFYQQHWSIVGDLVSHAVLNILNTGIFLTTLSWMQVWATPLSLTWQGIRWGRELLIKGLRWKIGEGRLIRSGFDPWIPRHTSFLPLTYSGPSNGVVANLITDERQWNATLLQQYFSPIDVDKILTLPLSYFPSRDKLIWHHHSSGNFTVQSAYHLATSLEDEDLSSTSTSTVAWWKLFWSLQVSQKVKIFPWRAIHDALPVATSLVRRKIITDSTCSICKQACESTGHALFSCKYAKAVWRSLGLSFNWSAAASMKNGDYVTHLSSMYNKTEMEQLFCTMWAIWIERNNIIHGKKARCAQNLAAFASVFLQNFRAAQQRSCAAIPVTTPATPALPHQPLPRLSASAAWHPPAAGTFKLNTDAAVDISTHKTGLGAVLRNANGHVKAALSMPMLDNLKSHEMEAKSLFYGLNWALQHHLPIDQIEMDALMVVNALKAPFNSNSEFSDLILDVLSLLSFFSNVRVSHVNRVANSAAHGLAKFALRVDETCTWLEIIPPPIYSIIVNESLFL